MNNLLREIVLVCVHSFFMCIYIARNGHMVIPNNSFFLLFLLDIYLDCDRLTTSIVASGSATNYWWAGRSVGCKCDTIVINQSNQFKNQIQSNRIKPKVGGCSQHVRRLPRGGIVSAVQERRRNTVARVQGWIRHASHSGSKVLQPLGVERSYRLAQVPVEE